MACNVDWYQLHAAWRRRKDDGHVVANVNRDSGDNTSGSDTDIR